MKIEKTKSYKNNNTNIYNIFNGDEYYTNKINQVLIKNIIKKDIIEYTNYMKKIYSMYSSQNLENKNFLIKNESNSDDSIIN